MPPHCSGSAKHFVNTSSPIEEMEAVKITFCVLLLITSSKTQYRHNNNGFSAMINSLVPEGNGDVQSVSACRISSRDLITTAQATANRVLQGVCNPRELGERFMNLESQIVDQFNVLKTMVLNLEDKLRQQDDKIKNQHRKLHRAISAAKALRRDGVSMDDDTEKAVNDVPGSHRGGHSLEDVGPSVRRDEMLKLNSTIISKDGVRMFTYYWQIRDMPYRMKSWGWKRSLRSQSFHIFPYGYKMYIRIYPNQNGTNVYIHVGLTQGEFDADLLWPFTLKHKILILNHHGNGEDLSSRVWDPANLCSASNWARPSHGDNDECVGLGFSQQILFSKQYLHGDTLVVKLRVYLD